ncbi:MAG: NAD(P)H-binding protein [Clostridia bacterium]
MRRFAFVLHPLRLDDFARKFPFTRFLPDSLVERLFSVVPPLRVAHVSGVRSTTGEELEGWLIGLPMTPRLILESPYPRVLEKLVRAGRMAESLGAEILGLGAFTKIAGDRGVTLSQRLQIPVTTGNSYTTATAVEGALAGARRLGLDPADARVAVIGATGSIGAACCQLLAEEVPELTLVARGRERLQELADELRARKPESRFSIETDIRRAVSDADIVIAVSSSPDAIVEPEALKPGALICDVARPRNLSRVVTERRPDVMVIDGGVIEVPGPDADMGFDFGFPPRMVEACMAETMALALEGRLENFTLGPTVDPDKVREIHRIAARHGFSMAGFRRFERAIPDTEFDRVRSLVAGTPGGRPSRRVGRPAPVRS